MRIGIISDTHLPSLIRRPDELGPQLGELLQDVDLILHGGDVTAPSVVEWCEQFAPTLIARGNNDLFEHPNMQDRHILEIEGLRIGLVHQLRPESRPMAALLADGLAGEQVDVLIAGDTHVERLEFRDEVLFMNPGSPTLPHHKAYRLGTVGILDVSGAQVRSEIVVLGHSEGAPNPARALSLVLSRDGRGLREAHD
ncbi:MAG: YfcE family phosphodiesterase [Gammaproteobacteria bacterium]|nr:YfcE family phosphodiesterase [Gammaproteobacteria bacterium]